MNLLKCPHSTAKLRPLAASFFLTLAFFLNPIFAQSATSGIITGHVSNEATSEPLWNAEVSLQGSNVSILTARDGNFRLEVPAGEQTIVVSYTGLDTKNVTVHVAANLSLPIEVSLTAKVYRLDAFKVKGVVEGRALALQQQKTSVNATQITATDTYGSPAANPGELLIRFPDITADIVGSEVRTLYVRGMSPDFLMIQVNGQQMATSFGTSASRQVQIEQLGTGNLEAIELIKAPKPENDANAIAGFVNLISKRGFDVTQREIAVNVGAMWRQRKSSANPFKDDPGLDIINASYRDSFSIFGGAKNLGVAVNINRRRSATTQDELGSTNNAGAATYFNAATATPLRRIYGVGDISYPAISTNLGFSADYRLGTAGSYLSFIGSLNTNNQYQRAHRWDIQTPAAATSFTAASTPDHIETVLSPSSSAQIWSYNFTKKSKNYMLNPSGVFKFWNNTAELAVNGAYSYAEVGYYDWNNLTANTARMGGLAFTLDRAGQFDPTFTQTAGPSVYDPASYTPSTLTKYKWFSVNTVRTLKVDFKKTLATTVPAWVKMGVKYAVDARYQDRPREQNWTWTGPTGISAYLDGTPYKVGNGEYGPFPFISPPGLGNANDIAKSSNYVWTDASQYNDFVSQNGFYLDVKEKVKSAYLEGGVDIGKLSILGGLRTEFTRAEGTKLLKTTTTALAFDSTLTLDQNMARALARFAGGYQTYLGTYKNIFPGVHMVYKAPKDVLVRFDYNASISRAPIASIFQNAEENIESRTLSFPNADLKPYTADCFELSVEKYFEPVGLFSVSAFYKSITNYISSFTGTVTAAELAQFDLDPKYLGWTWSQSRNIGSAWIRGINMRYEQQLRFLPGLWKGFGVFGNVTSMSAQGSFTGTSYSQRLAGQVPHSGNYGISFVHPKFELRLLANYRGTFPASNVAPGADLRGIDFRDGRTLYDFKSVYRVNQHFDIYLDVTNLTNQQVQTQTINDRKIYGYWEGVGFSAGVNARF